MLSESELLDLADRNLAESNRDQARWLAPTQIVEKDGLLLTAAGTRFPAGPFNSALLVGPTTQDPARVLDAAGAFYATLDRGFSLYARMHLDAALAAACERAGFFRISDPPGMVLDARVDAAVFAPGVELRTVRADDTQAIADLVTVCAAAYEALGLPVAITQKLFSQPSNVLAPHWRMVVLYAAGEPVCAAMLLFSHGIAGVYWVGTVPSARGRGYAEAVMRAISNDAFDAGARAVVLQASVFGEPVYKRIGYRVFTRYPWFLAPGPKKPSAP